MKTCFTHETLYSVTDSVNSMLLEDLKSGHKCANSGLTANCSKKIFNTKL